MNMIFKKSQRYKIFIHIFFIALSLCYIFPLLLVVSASFSSESALLQDGFSLIPKEFSTEAYTTAFANGKRVIRAYLVTIGSSGIGTLIAVTSSGLTAYALCRGDFAYKNFVSFVVFFSMLFSGGAIPSYIVYAKYYGLGDSFWIYILPAIAGGAWNILMMKSFMGGIPESLFESAKIDGASEFVNFSQIAIPLSKPVLATVGFMEIVARWNNWSTSYVYIRNHHLYTLQYLLQQIMNNTKLLEQLAEKAGSINASDVILPSESLKYALCVITAGPMLLVFPFFQKYFVKGTTIGAVKG